MKDVAKLALVCCKILICRWPGARRGGGGGGGMEEFKEEPDMDGEGGPSLGAGQCTKPLAF